MISIMSSTMCVSDKFWTIELGNSKRGHNSLYWKYLVKPKGTEYFDFTNFV